MDNPLGVEGKRAPCLLQGMRDMNCTSGLLCLIANIVTTSKALVTSSDALVTSSVAPVSNSFILTNETCRQRSEHSETNFVPTKLVMSCF